MLHPPLILITCDLHTPTHAMSYMNTLEAKAPSFPNYILFLPDPQTVLWMNSGLWCGSHAVCMSANHLNLNLGFGSFRKTYMHPLNGVILFT